MNLKKNFLLPVLCLVASVFPSTLFSQVNWNLSLKETETRTLKEYSLKGNVMSVKSVNTVYDEIDGRKVYLSKGPFDSLVFNKNGLLTKVYVYRDPSKEGHPQTDKGQLRMSYFFNDEGKILSYTIMNANKVSSRIKYIYNEQGLLEKEGRTNEDGIYGVSVFEYDSLGRVSAILRYPKDLEANAFFKCVKFYDSEGNLAEASVLRDGQTQIEKVSFSYDGNGNLVWKKTESGNFVITDEGVFDGSDIYEYEYSYNSNGDISEVKETHYPSISPDKRKVIIEKRTYKYDNNKNKLSVFIDNSDNHYTELTENKFDRFGNTIQINRYEIDRKTGHKKHVYNSVRLIRYY